MKVSFACSSFLKIREYETVASQPLSLPPFSPLTLPPGSDSQCY